MLSYVWPIALVVFSNTVYQICAKSAPKGMHPLASLTVTYLVTAAVTAVLFLLLSRGGSLAREYTHLNWAPFALGVVIVGLEVGFLYAYRAGWPVSIASVVQSSFLALALIFVGALFYREAITWNKLFGIVICLAGLAVLNLG